jgi:hypothetical protein
MTCLYSTSWDMNIGIFIQIFRDHLDAKQLTRNPKSIISKRILFWNLQYLWCQFQSKWIILDAYYILKKFHDFWRFLDPFSDLFKTDCFARITRLLQPGHSTSCRAAPIRLTWCTRYLSRPTPLCLAGPARTELSNSFLMARVKPVAPLSLVHSLPPLVLSPASRPAQPLRSVTVAY